MFLCVRSFVIQSEAMNLLLFPARFLTVFGMTRGGVRNDKGGSKSIFIQAYSPPPRCDAFFPTLRIGLNYLALLGLFFNS